MGANLETNELKGKILSIPVVDNTLTKEGCAADAKATGEVKAELKAMIDALDKRIAALEGTS